VTVSADGKWVYYNDSAGESRRVSIGGGAPEAAFSADLRSKLTEPLPTDFHEPMPSPDGAFIAGHYVDREARGERILLIPAAGGALKRFPTVPPNASWFPDGKALAFIDTRAGISNLMRQAVSGGGGDARDHVHLRPVVHVRDRSRPAAGCPGPRARGVGRRADIGVGEIAQIESQDWRGQTAIGPEKEINVLVSTRA